MKKIFRQGQGKVTADQLNSIGPETLRSIKSGPGIRLVGSHDSLIISAVPEKRKHAPMMDPFILAMVSSLDTDGNRIKVNFWDSKNQAWFANVSYIMKPFIMMFSTYNGKTIPYTDGSSRTYNTTGLNKAYQRRSTWSEGGVPQVEVQEITSPYYPGELLSVGIKDIPNPIRLIIGIPPAANGESTTVLFDTNEAGRHWAMKDE